MYESLVVKNGPNHEGFREITQYYIYIYTFVVFNPPKNFVIWTIPAISQAGLFSSTEKW